MRNLGYFRWCLWVLVFQSLYLNAQNESVHVGQISKPRTMGALGDSITAGALAQYKRQSGMFPWTHAGLVINILQFVAQQKISVFEDRALSWSTGMDPRYRIITHAERLEYMNPQLKVFNAAVSGSLAHGVLKNQLDDLSAWSLQQTGDTLPDYVTLLIGANDLCSHNVDSMTSASRFEVQIQDTIDRVMESPNTRLLVSSTPKVTDLKRFHGSRLMGVGPLKTCQEAWDLTKFCQVVTDDQPQHIQEIVKDRLETYNQILEEVVSSRREKYGDRIRIAKDIYHYEMSDRDLSIDCFHPNKLAHQKLSDLTFEKTWWQKDWAKVEEKARKEFKKRRQAHMAREAERSARTNHPGGRL